MRKQFQRYICDGCKAQVEVTHGVSLICTTDWFAVQVEICDTNKRAKKETRHFCPLCQKKETEVVLFVAKAMEQHRQNLKA